MCKKFIKNSLAFGKKCLKTAGGGGEVTHTVLLMLIGSSLHDLLR